MGKDLKISLLLDFYGALLTDKQTDALFMYYNNDYSLSEIAEELSISRQGVRDHIKRGEKQLLDFEEKLGLYERFQEIRLEIEKIQDLIDDNSSNAVEINRLCTDLLDKI